MREANPTENADRLQTLFDIITKCSSTLEKRLVIDVKWVKDAYEDFLISDVGFVRTQNNPVDTVTKLGTCAVLFYIILRVKQTLKLYLLTKKSLFRSASVFTCLLHHAVGPYFLLHSPLKRLAKLQFNRRSLARIMTYRFGSWAS